MLNNLPSIEHHSSNSTFHTHRLRKHIPHSQQWTEDCIHQWGHHKSRQSTPDHPRRTRTAPRNHSAHTLCHRMMAHIPQFRTGSPPNIPLREDRYHKHLHNHRIHILSLRIAVHTTVHRCHRCRSNCQDIRRISHHNRHPRIESHHKTGCMLRNRHKDNCHKRGALHMFHTHFHSRHPHTLSLSIWQHTRAERTFLEHCTESFPGIPRIPLHSHPVRMTFPHTAVHTAESRICRPHKIAHLSKHHMDHHIPDHRRGHQCSERFLHPNYHQN